ncbi:type III secretion system needle filament subunit SctF [Pseudomonas fuscovaginae UPB0736]|uniref:Type III secretion system major needle protein, YscF/MxiH/PrgI family n=1 Tax=Pseudomonas asplenii TaxID=53407 RepID=A0A1H6NGR1_9PSED|nr:MULTISPECIES: type III secretion system needle filament subunit SctF [Pseudomonas]UUQ66088.1 type III secretion system needle filament subunit SctF [Pseudomonas fuscovaginae UPB0736]UZE30687.1 type III secretion system needle filament subunit SctF [Pseudomonas asplenii]SEI14547.1 type III secretion system major needle protein, YscF/MxiH/PrgI family [Pseudomonas fuscovaginae]
MDVSKRIVFADDFLGKQAAAFESGAQDLKDILDRALATLKDDPSNPGLLASYQSAFSSYTVFRNVQTNTVKGFKDTSQTIIQAAR